MNILRFIVNYSDLSLTQTQNILKLFFSAEITSVIPFQNILQFHFSHAVAHRLTLSKEPRHICKTESFWTVLTKLPQMESARTFDYYDTFQLGACDPNQLVKSLEGKSTVIYRSYQAPAPTWWSKNNTYWLNCFLNSFLLKFW